MTATAPRPTCLVCDGPSKPNDPLVLCWFSRVGDRPMHRECAYYVGALPPEAQPEY
jgi:hypothetical protein